MRSILDLGCYLYLLLIWDFTGVVFEGEASAAAFGMSTTTVTPSSEVHSSRTKKLEMDNQVVKVNLKTFN